MPNDMSVLKQTAMLNDNLAGYLWLELLTVKYVGCSKPHREQSDGKHLLYSPSIVSSDSSPLESRYLTITT